MTAPSHEAIEAEEFAYEAGGNMEAALTAALPFLRPAPNQNDEERVCKLAREIKNAAQVTPLDWWSENLVGELRSFAATIRAEAKLAATKAEQERAIEAVARELGDHWDTADEIAAAIRRAK